jgi:cytochrome b subunit of formate dehydrogenase
MNRKASHKTLFYGLALSLPLLGWGGQMLASFAITRYYCEFDTNTIWHVITLIALIMSGIGIYFAYFLKKQESRKLAPTILFWLNGLIALIILAGDLATFMLEECL